MKHSIQLMVALSAASAFAATPEVSEVTLVQDANTRDVTITYAIANGPAVVTLDIQTNALTDASGEWVSIGAKNFVGVTGDVNRYVSAEEGTITWHPSLDWPEQKVPAKCMRAVVNAWALDNLPDYMAVDLNATSDRRISYYANAEAVPGGVLNPIFRTTSMLFRRMHARGVPFSMGATACEPGVNGANEHPCRAVIGNDYYIGVFEVTQAQWLLVYVDTVVKAKFTVSGSMRPMESVTIRRIREGADNNSSPNVYPDPPNASSFMGKLRTLTANVDQFGATGIASDLPSEAQWEFAARGGYGEGLWNDGSAILVGDDKSEDANLSRLGRNSWNEKTVGNTSDLTTCEPDDCTAICGSYEPNGYGLYDMHGNVMEYCVGRFQADISGLYGAVCTTGTDGIRRGGSWRHTPRDCRPSARLNRAVNGSQSFEGFRVMCGAGLR